MVTIQPAASESPKKKRTRFLLTKQSKFGCSTCKQRRIKCDEERPSCLRCRRSGRTCAGYPQDPAQGHADTLSTALAPPSGSIIGDSASIVSPLAFSPSSAPWSLPKQQHFVELACTVLGSDPFQLYSQSNLAVFTSLLPQLSLTAPFVNAATAAFGAAYDSAVLHHGDFLVSEYSETQYGLALQLLQLELNRRKPQFAPLLIASTMLAAAETIQARQKCALTHVLGAFGIFASRRRRQILNSTDGPVPDDHDFLRDDTVSMLEHLCLAMDLQVATFTWGVAPNLPPQVFTETTFNPRDVTELSQELPKLLHNSLHFIAEASQETFKEYTDLPFDLVVRQGRMISWLRKWLASFHELVETSIARFSFWNGRERNLMLLKAQCLSILIAVSNMRTTTQTSYDKYAREFEELVRCANIVLTSSDSSISTPPRTSLVPFNPSLGIIQPLFFTARKYRHSLVRRRAISLLRLAGFEGPFSGDFEADLGTRIAEIEEARAFSMDLRNDQVMNPADIPDWRRICSCWRLNGSYELHERTIKFCRRRESSYAEDGFSFSKSAVTEDERWETWEEAIRTFKGRIGDYADVDFSKRGTSWVPLAGEANFPRLVIDNARLSRDPDWAMSALGSRNSRIN